MKLPVSEFLKLRNDLRVADVRSESEFKAGHIRGAANIPLLNDGERIIVGTTYKQRGQKEAIKEGFRLVGPRLNEIIEATEFLSGGEEILVHCWRGGMRSENFSRFAEMAGIRSHTLTGGYKSYRHEALESYKSPMKIMLLTGCTGSGKSEILRQLATMGEQIIDLEKLASHKGSAFGHLFMAPQPTTEQFQNELFEEILKLDLSRRIWVEDESIAIGKIFLPDDFWRQMSQSPIIQMEVSKEVRIERLVKEYGDADREEFLAIMGKIRKKLGGQHFNAAKEKLELNDMAATIDLLLTYYDKAYLDSITRRKDRIDGIVPWDGKNPIQCAKQILDHVQLTTATQGH